MRKKIENYIRAGYPAVSINTPEEPRATNEVIEAAKAQSRSVYIWDAVQGLRQITPNPGDLDDTQDLMAALTYQPRQENAVYIWRDLAAWPLDRDPVLSRAWRDFLAWGPENGTCSITINPNYEPRPDVEKMIVCIDFELPDAAALEAIARAICDSANVPFNGNADAVTRALAGLSTTEAENACALSLVESGRLDPALIYREKVQQVRKTGLLDIITPDPRGLDAIGGQETLKDWIRKRKKAFSKRAAAFPLDPSKGILLLGPPGTGKSLAAKCICNALEIPGLLLDLGRMFNSLVGETEARLRAALALAAALAPCVLWLDEVEKGLAGSSGANDSGVSKKVLGTLLTWMQERKAPVFLVCTANNLTALEKDSPELLRKGRFDNLFCIDLPDPDERRAIFRIHLEKRKRGDLADSIITDELITATDTFTGSEIEALIVEALFTAFDDEEREITAADLLAAARNTVPLAKTAKESIDAIRQWGATRATPAGKSRGTDSTGSTKPKPRRLGTF